MIPEERPERGQDSEEGRGADQDKSQGVISLKPLVYLA
jgi:hypothetical protein